MPDRIVTYNLKIIADKGNKKESAKVVKEAKAALDEITKHAAKSTAARGKEEKKAADTGVKEVKRVASAQKQAATQRTASVKQAAGDERREREGILNHAIRATRSQEREETRARKTKEREQKRSMTRLASDTIKQHRAMERSGQKVWQASDAELRRHNKTVATLKGLLDDGKLSQVAYKEAVAKSQTAMYNAGETGREAFGPKLIAGIKSVATALGAGLGLAGVIRGVRSELEGLSERAERARQSTLSLDEAMEESRINLQASSVAEETAFNEKVFAASKDLNRRPRDIFRSTAGTLASRGVLSTDVALQASVASLAVRPGNAEDAASLAAAALDLIKQVGPELTPEAAIGFIVDTASKSRVTSPGKVGIMTAGITGAMIAAGGTPRQGAALGDALTQSIPDPKGQKSRTGAISIIESTMTLVPEIAAKRLKDAREGIEKGSKPLDTIRGQVELAALELEGLKLPSAEVAESIAGEEAKLRDLRRKGMDPDRKRQLIGASERKLASIKRTGELERKQEEYAKRDQLASLRETLKEREELAAKVPSLQAQLPGLEDVVRRTTDATFPEILAVTQKDPELSAAVLDKLKLEKIVLESARQIIAGDARVKLDAAGKPKPNAYSLYNQIAADLSPILEAAPKYEQMREIQEASPTGRIVAVGRAFQGSSERITTRNRAGALSGVAQNPEEGVSALLKDTGKAVLPTWVTEKRADLAEMFGGEEAGIIERRAALENRVDELVHPLGVKTSAWGVGQTFPREPTEKARADAGDLKIASDSLGEELANIRRATEEQAEATRDNTDATRDLTNSLDRPQGETQPIAPRDSALPTMGRNP